MGKTKRRPAYMRRYSNVNEMYPGADIEGDAMLLGKLVERRMRERGQKFPTVRDVLECAKLMGYRKCETSS